jgi:two-component system chemotaxis sensor kinase CheA
LTRFLFRTIYFLSVDQTQHEFSAEIEERIEHLFAAIDELRNRLADGPARRELLDRVFRNTHNIKGSAAAIGLKRVSQIAHEFENLLVSVRSGRIILDGPTLDSFEEAAQMLLDNLMDRGRAVSPFELSQESPPLRLNSEGALNSLPAELLNSLTEEERWKLAAAVDEGANLFVVATSFDIHDFEEQFRHLQERLKSHGEIISSSPTIGPEQPTRINFRIVYVSKVDLLELRSKFDRPPDVVLNFVGAQERTGTSVMIASEPRANLIQVKLDDLDQLAASAHNLFVQTTSTLERTLSDKVGSEISKNLAESIESVRRNFMALEKEIIGLRMIPIGRTLQRAVRAGRAAARAAGKDIDFEVSGAKILMEKLMVNAISDPLIHLVRNAVDHGIESAAERVLLGKTKRGRVRIQVTSDGGQSIVTVSDDGRGVNPVSIARAAAELGIVTEGTTVDLQQSLRLIFRPGFSSAQSVSGVSGRGVGLDVVETTVEQAGGKVRVSSEVGAGTIFEIILPVSFGLLDSTVIRSENYRYCLETGLIRSGQQIEDRQIEVANEGQVLKIGNEAWPVLHLRALLGQPLSRSVSGDLLQLLLCEFRQQAPDYGKRIPKRLGLIVDAIEGSEEVLVRGLGSHGGRWRGVAGATELRNGGVALVLDLPRLIESKYSKKLAMGES